jgi:Zn-finger protein
VRESGKGHGRKCGLFSASRGCVLLPQKSCPGLLKCGDGESCKQCACPLFFGLIPAISLWNCDMGDVKACVNSVVENAIATIEQETGMKLIAFLFFPDHVLPRNRTW